MFSLANRAKEIFESSEVEEKKMLLRFLLQNPVMDRKKPHYNLESPFDLILKMDDSAKWLDTLVLHQTLARPRVVTRNMSSSS